MKKNNAFSVFGFIHKAMLAGQLIFLGVMFYLGYSKTMIPPLVEQEKILQVAAIVFTAAAIYIGIRIFNRKLALIKEDPLTKAKEKFTKYSQACMLRWSVTEAPVLICGICYLLTGNIAFLALAALPFLFFVMLAPVKSKVMSQLQISESELEDL
jgi:hypothetical protein